MNPAEVAAARILADADSRAAYEIGVLDVPEEVAIVVDRELDAQRGFWTKDWTPRDAVSVIRP